MSMGLAQDRDKWRALVNSVMVASFVLIVSWLAWQCFSAKLNYVVDTTGPEDAAISIIVVGY
jgi:hypothetical protein